MLLTYTQGGKIKRLTSPVSLNTAERNEEKQIGVFGLIRFFATTGTVQEHSPLPVSESQSQIPRSFISITRHFCYQAWATVQVVSL